MAKRKKKATAPEVDSTGIPQTPGLEADVFNPYVGSEEDDLADMEYVQDENSQRTIETMPPETKEEAEMQQLSAETEDPTPIEDTVEDEESVEEGIEASDGSDAEEPEAVEEEVVEGIKVPKDRFDEVNEKRKKAEERAERLQAQIDELAAVKEEVVEEPPEPYDYASQDKEALDAALEGDQEKYNRIQAEIREQQRLEILAAAKQLASQGDQEVRETITFEEAGAAIEAAYPEFSQTTDVYNPEAREELLDLYLGYAQSGRYSRVEALQRASDKAARLYGLDRKAEQETPDNVVSIKPSDPKSKVAVAKKQPPAMEGKARETQEPRTDYASMSDEEFDMLPDAAKARARGDFL